MPISDGIRATHFPWVNLALIVATFAVWIFYELPHLGSSVSHASFYPCSVAGSCHPLEPWEISWWFTAMFMHASWSHILGNMLFLAIFGKNVEDAFGHMRYLVLYVTGGLVAAASQTSVTLIAGTSADARVPMLGASGAIAAVLGAYLVLYPQSRILTIIGVFPLRIRAWVFLGVWFIYQLVEAHFGLYSAGAAMAGPRSSPTSAASCSVRRSRRRSSRADGKAHRPQPREGVLPDRGYPGWPRPRSVGESLSGLARTHHQPRSSVDRFVSRPGLFERVSATAAGTVTLVCAPAGSGKTVLLRSWTAELDEPVAWVTVDRGERTCQRFWLHLIDALAHAASDEAIERVSPAPSFAGAAVVARLQLGHRLQSEPDESPLGHPPQSV